MLVEDQWHAQLDADLTQYYKQDPRFRIIIVTPRSINVVDVGVGLESCALARQEAHQGGQPREEGTGVFEDINETLEHVSVFLCSLVIEPGAEVMLEVNNIYGLLRSKMNSQRAFCADDQTL